MHRRVGWAEASTNKLLAILQLPPIAAGHQRLLRSSWGPACTLAAGAAAAARTMPSTPVLAVLGAPPLLLAPLLSASTAAAPAPSLAPTAGTAAAARSACLCSRMGRGLHPRIPLPRRRWRLLFAVAALMQQELEIALTVRPPRFQRALPPHALVAAAAATAAQSALPVVPPLILAVCSCAASLHAAACRRLPPLGLLQLLPGLCARRRRRGSVLEQRLAVGSGDAAARGSECRHL